MENFTEFRPVAKDKILKVCICRTVTSFISLRGRRSKGKVEEESRSEKRDLRERKRNGSEYAVAFVTSSHN